MPINLREAASSMETQSKMSTSKRKQSWSLNSCQWIQSILTLGLPLSMMLRTTLRTGRVIVGLVVAELSFTERLTWIRWFTLLKLTTRGARTSISCKSDTTLKRTGFWRKNPTSKILSLLFTVELTKYQPTVLTLSRLKGLQLQTLPLRFGKTLAAPCCTPCLTTITSTQYLDWCNRRIKTWAKP